jgi:hypothetical protein
VLDKGKLTDILELRETYVFKGYSRRKITKENRYITTISEAFARIYAKFGNNLDFIEKLVR